MSGFEACLVNSYWMPDTSWGGKDVLVFLLLFFWSMLDVASAFGLLPWELSQLPASLESSLPQECCKSSDFSSGSPAVRTGDWSCKSDFSLGSLAVRQEAGAASLLTSLWAPNSQDGRLELQVWFLPELPSSQDGRLELQVWLLFGLPSSQDGRLDLVLPVA